MFPCGLPSVLHGVGDLIHLNEDTSHTGGGPALLTSFSYNSFLKTRSRYNHIQRNSGYDINTWTQSDLFQPIITHHSQSWISTGGMSQLWIMEGGRQSFLGASLWPQPQCSKHLSVRHFYFPLTDFWEWSWLETSWIMKVELTWLLITGLIQSQWRKKKSFPDDLKSRMPRPFCQHSGSPGTTSLVVLTRNTFVLWPGQCRPL